jgi:hypothetical protein
MESRDFQLRSWIARVGISNANDDDEEMIIKKKMKRTWMRCKTCPREYPKGQFDECMTCFSIRLLAEKGTLIFNPRTLNSMETDSCVVGETSSLTERNS